MSSNEKDLLTGCPSLLFCFSGPAASGKSTICSELTMTDKSLSLSVSTTTRAPRSGEREGVHYNFVSPEEFEKRVEDGRFLEHAVFGNARYGTEKSSLEKAGELDRDLLLDIDVQGVRQIENIYPERLVVIFVFPPSFSILTQRFSARGSETEEQMIDRLEIARQEVAQLRKPDVSDYLVVNGDLQESIKHARAIIRAERIRIERHSESYLDDLFSR